MGNLEYQEHDHGKNRNTQEFVGQHGVNGIAGTLLFREDFPLFHLGYQRVDKGEALAVRILHDLLVGQVDVTLGVRSLLCLAVQLDSSVYHCFQAFSGSRYGFQNRAAQLGGEGCSVNGGLLLGVDVTLVQSDHHRNAQLQQLGGEKQTAAEIGGIHDVDNGIRVLIANIGTGDALLRGKRGHGVGTGQIHRDQIFGPAVIGFLDGVFLFLHRHAGPVAHLFVPPGKGVVHGGLAGVRVACQGNTHG